MTSPLDHLPTHWPSWFYKELTESRLRLGMTLESVLTELRLAGHSGVELTMLTHPPFPVMGNWHEVVPLLARIVGTDSARLFAPILPDGRVDAERMAAFVNNEHTSLVYDWTENYYQDGERDEPN